MGEEGKKKALLICLPPNRDLGDLIQIARAEGKKIFHGHTVSVVDADRRSPNEWLVVVQDSEVVSGSKMNET